MLKLLKTIKQNNSKISSNTGIMLAGRAIHTSNKVGNQQRAVIFDMGGVMYPTPVPLVKKFAVKHKLTQSQMDDLLFKGDEKSLWGQVECGEISVETFSKGFSQRCQELFGSPYEDEIIKTMLVDKRYHTPYPEMLSAVKQLKDNGFKTALLTNNFRMENGQTCMSLDRDLFDVVSSFSRLDPYFSL